MTIHPTAIIADGAIIDPSCTIGPYCVIGDHVIIGPRTVLRSHVVVDGRTTIGSDNDIFPFASLGQVPQDLKYQGEPTTLEIGDHNVIRESCTFHIGTAGGGGKTVIGDHNLFMGLVHIGHDCVVGSHCVLAQAATLGGHVAVDDHVVVGGMSACHQFVRVGRHSMIGGLTPVTRDVLPYTTVAGERGAISGLNLIGLRRRGFSRDQIRALQSGYKALFQSTANTIDQRLSQVIAELPDSAELRQWQHFIAGSKRGICTKVVGDS